MRIAILAGILAAAAHAAPLISPRVHLVAARHLPADSLGDGSGDPRAIVTARIPGGAARLQALGFVARELGGGVAELRVDADELHRLASTPGLIQLDERRILRPLLDKAAALVNAPTARALSGLDGSGVLVAIIDTGADARHADLRGLDGKTKIDSLLDLSQPDDGRHTDLGSWGGAVWLRDDIDAALAAEAAGMTPSVPLTSRDTQGHGTHVAGIATSTGLATGNGLPAGRYVGIAPGADLVIAKATRGNGVFLDGDVVTACQFALARAATLGRPLVINLSLGGGGGAHDGTSNTETALDALFASDTPGRVMVVAAGNAGLEDAHAGGWGLDGEVTIPLKVDASAAQSGRVAIDLWSEGPLAISVTSPSGTASAGDGTAAHSDDGSAAIDHTSPARGDGRQPSAIVFSGASGASVPQPGTWQIHLRGSAVRWDLWMTETPGGLPNARFTDHLDEDDRLAIPGSARGAISVGSFVSRNGWLTVDGKTVTRDTELGVPSLFSSSGPSADGRFTPDLAAPGEFVISSLSADAHPDQPGSDFFVGANDPTFAWADDGQHGVLRGTSQAAPFVAGAAALLLEAAPDLNTVKIREILRVSAHDGGAGWSPRAGFGLLDVAAAVDAAQGRFGGALDPARSSVGVSYDQLPPGESITTVTVTPRDSEGRPLGPGHTIDVTVSAGEPAGPVVDTALGRWERPIVAHASRGQVGVVTASVDGVELAAHPNIYFVLGRDEIGRPFHAGGGCSSGGAPPASAFLATLLLLLWSKRLRG